MYNLLVDDFYLLMYTFLMDALEHFGDEVGAHAAERALHTAL